MHMCINWYHIYVEFYWHSLKKLTLLKIMYGIFFRYHRICISMCFPGHYRADSKLVPSQWETSLQSNTISHWLGANLKSALHTFPISDRNSNHWLWCGGVEKIDLSCNARQINLFGTSHWFVPHIPQGALNDPSSVSLTYTWACTGSPLCLHIDGLVLERCNSVANALELRLFCTNPSICPRTYWL